MRFILALMFCLSAAAVAPLSSVLAEEPEFPCVRGEAEPLFSGKAPGIRSYSFTTRTPTEATEKVVFASGDRVTIENGGCEYYIHSFRYESTDIPACDSSAVCWATEAAKALRKLQARKPSVVFDLTRAAETLERLARKPGELSLETEYPVEGDGEDFLQSRVVLKGGGRLDGQSGGYVLFDLVKGPL